MVEEGDPYLRVEIQVEGVRAPHNRLVVDTAGGNFIRKVEVLEYPELGMEAIYEFDVEAMPVTVAVDAAGSRAPAAGSGGERGEHLRALLHRRHEPRRPLARSP